MKQKKRVVKRQKDTRKITVTIPEEIYFHIKQYAKDEIRTISQQARLFLEIGLQVMMQQEQAGDDEEPQEQESAIGFQIDRGYEDDEE
jgi:hypothetical protein